MRTASERAGIEIEVYAVEKNPNAVVTLQNAKISENWDNVTIGEFVVIVACLSPYFCFVN